MAYRMESGMIAAMTRRCQNQPKPWPVAEGQKVRVHDAEGSELAGSTGTVWGAFDTGRWGWVVGIEVHKGAAAWLAWVGIDELEVLADA